MCVVRAAAARGRDVTVVALRPDEAGTNELQFRGDAHDGAEGPCCTSRRSPRALRCGPLTAPNHKLVPDARWILELPARPRARARRSRRPAPQARRGALRHEPLRDLPPRLQQPGRPDLGAGAARRLAADRDQRLRAPRMPAAERRWARPLAARRARRWRRSACGSGASARASPTSTTPTRTRISWPGAIGMFGHTYNPNYFINPPAYTYLLPAAFRSGSAGERASRAPSRPTRRTSSRSRGRCRRVLGGARRRAAGVGGRRLFDRRIGLVAGALLAVAFLPVHYAHFALNDVPTLAPRVPGAGRRRRGIRARAAGDYALAGVGAGARLRDEVHRRDRAAAAAGGGAGSGPGQAPRGADRGARAGRRARARARSWSPTRSRCSTSARSARGWSEQSAASSDGGGKLGLTGEQRDRLLPRDADLGARLAAGAGALGGAVGARGARLAARARARAGARPLRGCSWARRTATSRAGCCRSIRWPRCWPPNRGAGRARLAARGRRSRPAVAGVAAVRAGARVRDPQRRRARPRRHAPARARLDGQARAGRLEGGDRAGGCRTRGRAIRHRAARHDRQRGALGRSGRPRARG